MSYVIIKTDGTVLTTITDGTINTTSTSLGLPGRLYPGYGQVMDTNFVHVVENFADIAPPPNPLQGQLWCDTSNATPVLKVCPADNETNALAWYTVVTTGGDPLDIDVGNVVATGNVDANNFNATNTVTANLVDTDYLTVNTQANIVNANISGNANVANINATNGVFGNISGNGAGLSSITGANVTGTVANATNATSATSATTAGTVTTAAQPNITSVGILTSVAVAGNVTAGSVFANSGIVNALNLRGEGGNISNVQGANVSGTVPSSTTAVTAGSVTNPVQSNITQVGTLSSLNSSGLVTAQRFSASVANGTAPMIIQSTTKVANLNADLLDGYDTDVAATPTSIVVRDASGNVSGNYIIGNGAFLTGLNSGTFSQITNGTSNVAVLAPGGNVAIGIGGTANLAVFSNQGLEVVSNVNANNVSANRLAGSLTTAAQPNVTSLGTLTSLTVSGNISGANLTGTHYGNAVGLTNIPGANVSGQAPLANYSTFAGVIINGAQPNITSVGTLSSLTVTGKVTAGQLQGEGGNISNIQAANLSGSVPSATTATTAGTVTTAAQPNITSVSSSFGNLTFATNGSINIPGTVSQIIGANLISANFFQGNGSRLSSITGANVTGTVANATYAASAGTVASIPSGTRMLFAQTTAPTGWTKQTASDNAALRVVSGAAGSGGSVNFTSAFTSQVVSGTVGDTALSEGQLPSHRHYMFNSATGSTDISSFPNSVPSWYGTSGGDTEYSIDSTNAQNGSYGYTDTTGSGQTHTHSFSGTSINLAVKYVDVIIAQKD